MRVPSASKSGGKQKLYFFNDTISVLKYQYIFFKNRRFPGKGLYILPKRDFGACRVVTDGPGQAGDRNGKAAAIRQPLRL